MGIGEALAQVRHQAGLTVAEVSQRTRIREALIRDIENNDYSACGGDFYARGHIRAIAKATGAAPEPLIREFNASRQIPQALTLDDIFRDTPATPIMPGTAATTRGPHRPNKTQALAVAVLAALLLALGFAAYGLLSGLRHAATAAPQARGQPTAPHELDPNRRALAAVPAPPPVQRRVRTPVSTAADGPYDGQRSKSQTHAAGDRPRSHRSQVSQLVDQRPLRAPGSGHLHGHGLRPPADHTRADRPWQRFRRGDPGARRAGGPTAYRPHGPRGRRGATAARHTSPRPLSAHPPHPAETGWPLRVAASTPGSLLTDADAGPAAVRTDTPSSRVSLSQTPLMRRPPPIGPAKRIHPPAGGEPSRASASSRAASSSAVRISPAPRAGQAPGGADRQRGCASITRSAR